MALVVAFGVLWIGLGGISAVMLIRRGHDVTTWVTLGLVAGPVAPLLALRAVEDEGRSSARVVRAGEPDGGPIDLVAGIDGSREAVAALRAAVELHRGNLGRTVVALVVPFDGDDDARLNVLRTASDAIAPVTPTEVELRGEPVAALQRFAEDGGFDLIVVGARGRGGSTSPLGSVATRLAGGSTVPVLVGPRSPRP